MPRLIVLAVLVLLAACAHVPPQRVQLPEPRIAPAAMALDTSLAQRLTFRAGNSEPQVIDAHLEIDAVSLRLAGFVGGQRVLLLHWDGIAIEQQRSERLPPQVRADTILRDIQFVYAPTEALKTALPQGWRLRDSDTRRELSLHDTAAIVIDYATMPRWNGAVTLDNRIEGYRLDIESAAAAVDSN